MADGDLEQSDFDIAFSFTRPLAADYRNSSGNSQSAAINVPRFDHDDQGNALGLLVEGGPYLGQADRVMINPLMLPDDITGQEVTIFHRFTASDGPAVRRAWYTRDAIAMINVLLSGAGHHVEIGLIEGFRENKGGYVRYRTQSWLLAPLIDAGDGVLLADDAGRAFTTG